MSGLEFEATLRWSPRRGRSSRGDRPLIEVAIAIGAEVGVLFGASGAGKSSILRLVAGLDRPESGRVRVGSAVLFDAEAGIDLPLRRRRVGLIFQDDLLFPHLDVARNVGFGLRGWARAEARRRVGEVADVCGVASLLGRWPETLSGGERQRVGLARALAPRPRLLLCDEPVSALDLAGRDVLLDRLRAVREAEGIPALYVTHSPAEAVALGSTLFLLEAGRIVDRGPPLDVLARSRAAPLAGVQNRFEGVIEGESGIAGESRVRLDGGGVLIVPRVDRADGSRVVVRVGADEILLASIELAAGALSARNVLAGRVDRVVGGGGDGEVEVLIRAENQTWVVGVVGSAVGAMGLCEGAPVSMIVKARSCRVTPAG